MRVCLDIEANALDNPTEIWVIVAKDIDTGETHVFRRPTSDPTERHRFEQFWGKTTSCVGHNLLGYDLPVIRNLLGLEFSASYPASIDTLVISHLADYPRKGHSLADYGEEFGLEKIEFTDFSKYSKEMEEYCVRDVEITHLVYNHYNAYVGDVSQHVALSLEQEFQVVCNDLRSNGFCFDRPRAERYLATVVEKLRVLDEEIKKFPAKFSPIREVTPRETKFGTISLSSIPKSLRKEIHTMTVDAPFTYGEWIEFNPNSVRQQVDILWQAGWKPIDKTKTHALTREEPTDRMVRYGWKVNENNLNTLP